MKTLFHLLMVLVLGVFTIGCGSPEMGSQVEQGEAEPEAEGEHDQSTSAPTAADDERVSEEDDVVPDDEE